MAQVIDAGPSMLEDAEDAEVTMRRRKRRRRAAVVAVSLGTVYYSAAIAYYTQRGRKVCRDNPDPGNCSYSCWESWDAVDAVYFATVTMTSVGYGDIKPESTENMAVTLVFLLFGFIVRATPPVAAAGTRARCPAVHAMPRCARPGPIAERRAGAAGHLRAAVAGGRAVSACATASARPCGRRLRPRKPPRPCRRAFCLPVSLSVPVACRPSAMHAAAAPPPPPPPPPLCSQIVFPSIAQAMAPVYQGLELVFFRVSDAMMRVFIGKRADGTLVDLDGDGMADYEEPPPAYLYYLKGVSSWLIMWILTQAIFAALYMLMDPGTFSYGSAFYFCIVTATTVGYGDIYVSDASGHRLFASFHILYSVSSLAALLNTVQVLHSERMIQIRKATLLQRQLDPDLIQSLDKDNNGLDKLEFVVGMLTKLEILHWDDVEPFLAQFDALDVDKSGRLDKSDLLRLVDMQREKVERAAKAKEVARLKALEAAQHTARAAGARDPSAAMEEGGVASSTHDGAGRSRADDDDLVHEFTPPGGDGYAVGGVGKGIDADGGAGGVGGAAGGAPEPAVYGGRGARCRELGMSTSPEVEAQVLRRKRLIPFVGGGLPMQVLAGVRRPRRPRHLRGKVNPGG